MYDIAHKSEIQRRVDTISVSLLGGMLWRMCCALCTVHCALCTVQVYTP